MLSACVLCDCVTGFSGDFWREYHTVIPKAPLFDKRKDLYLLYHYLNHTNLFGGERLGAACVTLTKAVLQQHSTWLGAPRGPAVCMTLTL